MAYQDDFAPILNGLLNQIPDSNPEETQEWRDSLDALVENAGKERARYLMLDMIGRARQHKLGLPALTGTDYINTIHPNNEPDFPGDEDVERRYRAFMRWNAAVQVHRAQAPGVGVGGHISTYASSATMYEVGFNHFFRGHNHPGGGDQIFVQGHGAPGIYARAFLEGRLSEADMDGFRQEKSAFARGLPSYPHPRLMPDFWQFPTVSMGLGPMNAIYQAQFNRYLHHRNIKDTSDQHVWAFLGDGEMDEPESRGLLHVAGIENLDNLTFVVNCNLQRLDGPVRGNGKIMQELEATFRGAGWNVIKVVWGRGWDPLFEADTSGALINLMNTTPDGDFQTYRANNGEFVRRNFFERDPRAAALVADWSDEDIWWKLKRGGHDYRKMYAAYHEAMHKKGKPTVILAKTIKGYALGSGFAGRNATHQMKKLDVESLVSLRDTLDIPITDSQLDIDPYRPPYYRPAEDSPEIEYLMERRRELGGFVPSRRTSCTKTLPLPEAKTYRSAAKGSGKQQVATTMAFVRLLRDLMRHKEFGERVVPIIPDEARTFGMDSFFPTSKIYNPHGQNYTSVDAELMLKYTESVEGQILHLGINEAGSTAAFTAAGTSYATHDEPMIPVYIFYSMFGFQRTGDSFWAAADQMTRGFVIGATAGRTTLTGEGLQHADGHSPLLASTNPGVVSYDPAYAYELGHIIRDGLERMYGDGGFAPHRDNNVMYYLTVYNEPISQPAEPDNLDVTGLLRGMYLANPGHPDTGRPRVQLLGSGVALPWAIEAQEILGRDFGVDADVWSVTSWNELRREAMDCEEAIFLDPSVEPAEPYVTKVLRTHSGNGPYIAVSDYMRQVPDQIAPYVPGDFTSLGADGFGFSDTRPAARRHFHIDGPSVAYVALRKLAQQGKVPADAPTKCYRQFKLDDVSAGTSGNTGGDA